ncbi:hypothetical protein D9757_015524 [Collybiopsis confluens]|uniref:Retrotransposon gag domain-containing protein n=1 Tax=Collybiopsis confluens TaxID=2823264 RepID=A0A8H5C6R2_9AGAR|nr:hypothetical protein D9757_015524 [Collybiopsis confluens]
MATGQDVLNALNTLATNQAALQQVVTDLVTNMNSNKGGIPRIRTLAGHEPVKSAISFLEGEAAIWATPIAENISAHTLNNNVALTYPTWADFKAAFIARFETADPVTDAKTMLKTLYQGKNSVASYAATFKQYSGRTDTRTLIYETSSTTTWQIGSRMAWYTLRPIPPCWPASSPRLSESTIG